MKSKKQISVIIPTFNDANYLQEALKSLTPLWSDLEIIVVDDASTTEESKAILSSLEKRGVIVYRLQENVGPSKARNFGVEKCSGDYLLFLDADNKIISDLITQSLKILEEDPKTGVVYSAKKTFGAEEREIRPGPFELERMLNFNYIDTCAVVRKKAFEESDGFVDLPDFPFEDWALWLNLYQKGWRFHYIDKILFHYRLRPEGSRGQNGYLNKDVHTATISAMFPALYAEAIMKKQNLLDQYQDSNLFPLLKKWKIKLGL